MQSLIAVALDLHPLNLLTGGYDWIILLVVAVLLFGGTRLAGIGKGAGRAIREFKEETDGIRSSSAAQQVGTGTGATAAQPVATQPVQPVATQPVATQPAQPVVAQPVQQVPSMDQQAAADVLPHQNTQNNL